MPVYYGREIAKHALREIGVIDPIEAGTTEVLTDACEVATRLIDRWRTQRLTIRAVTRATYNLVAAQQSYTIGLGGNFNQDYPESIAAWSIIQDGAATDPNEIPMGEPFTWDEWQRIRTKSQTAPWPIRMWFDKAFTAHVGKLWFHPIPETSDPDVVLYQRVPVMTSLLPATQYDLEPAFADALILNLAVRLCPRHKVPLTEVGDVKRDADHALGDLKRSHVQLLESPMRSEFSIGNGGGRRTFNIYQGSS